MKQIPHYDVQFSFKSMPYFQPIISKRTSICYLKSRHKAANVCICVEYTSEINQ